MNKDKSREFWAGIFLLTGLALIAGLIILFGEVPDLFKPTYIVTVKFPNAAGLLKGSDVFLSGAQIGKVITDPQPIPDTQKVEVRLKIDKKVGIRKDASYDIGSSGLLGDKFVEVKPKEYKEGTSDIDKAPYVQNGDVIEGASEQGLPQLMDASLPLIDRANHIAAQLDDMITRLNVDVLSDTSTDDLKETISKLRHMVDNGDAMITNANDLLSQAKTGKGVIGRLMTDKKLGDNLAVFMANLKEHGPIFYHDDTSDKDTDDGTRKKNK